jgi:hypothetical protein
LIFVFFLVFLWLRVLFKICFVSCRVILVSWPQLLVLKINPI